MAEDPRQLPGLAPGEAAPQVVLVHPEIPWNTGNIGRTCLATGVRLHLVEPLGFRLTDRYLRRAGLDYWHRLEPRIWPDWQTLEAQLGPDGPLGEPLLFSAEGRRSLWQVEFPNRPVLVFGREGGGLPEELRQRYAERLVRVPMADDPQIRSLNLSTTVAVVLYEVLRQRRARSPRT